tara:strand:- start:5939 stop:6256 length:318 start_codon:yes stop_codon:yes gene_type:complete
MTQNFNKLFLIVTVLGVYAGSMYKLGIVSAHVPNLEAPHHSPEDIQKIYDVVRVQSSQEEVPQYVPGVACVIQATPDMSIDEMQLRFEDCAKSHTDHLQSVTFDR